MEMVNAAAGLLKDLNPTTIARFATSGLATTAQVEALIRLFATRMMREESAHLAWDLEKHVEALKNRASALNERAERQAVQVEISR